MSRQSDDADSHGLLKRYPVTACGFHLIGKETERGFRSMQVTKLNNQISEFVAVLLHSDLCPESVEPRLQSATVPMNTPPHERTDAAHTIWLFCQCYGH